MNDRSPATVKCSVIIVSFNQHELLKAAIESLKKNPPPFNYEIIVVDNHSDVDVQEFLNDYFHDIRVIHNYANHGFGWANNRGAQAARGEYLLFLNSDAEVIGPAVEAMVRVMEKDTRIGVLGPLLLNSDGSFQLSYGPKISLSGEFYQKNLAPLIEKWRCAWQRGRPFIKKKAWVSGACLLLRKDLFGKDPPFDENMFLYFEDQELCLRVRAMGKKVVYYGGAKVRHHGGRSGAGLTGIMIEYRKSQLYFYRKHLQRWQSFLLRRYLSCKFRRQMRRAHDENGKQAAAGVLEFLKEL